MNTAELTEAILVAASEVGCLLVRNNSGVAKHVKDGKTWFVRYGVGTKKGGGGDLIGLACDGIFVSVEIKIGDDKQTDEQAKWERWVKARNGRAGVARTVDDALAIIAGNEKPVPRCR